MSCVICLKNHGSHENLYELSCKHSFCNSCITHWLLINNHCPCCRKEIVSVKEKKKKLLSFRFSTSDNVIFPINIYDSVVDRIQNIINIIYFNEPCDYNWKIKTENNETICTTNIYKKKNIYELTLYLYEYNDLIIIIISNIKNIIKYNIKDKQNIFNKYIKKLSKNYNKNYNKNLTRNLNKIY